MSACICSFTCVCLWGAVQGRFISSCVFLKKQDVVVSVCNSAPLKVCLCICLSHLQQCFVLEKLWARTGVCFKVYVFDKLRIK